MQQTKDTLSTDPMTKISYKEFGHKLPLSRSNGALHRDCRHFVVFTIFWPSQKVFWTATSKNLFFVKNAVTQRLNLPSERMELFKPAKLAVIKVFLFGKDHNILLNLRWIEKHCPRACQLHHQAAQNSWQEI